jgi:anti-anti-sigma regulatory factor
MLRISVHDDLGALTFKLEGRLAGNWVHELRDCWQEAIAARSDSAVRFDLTQVTSIDADGKALLSAAAARGAKLVAAGCFMRAMVAEIADRPLPYCAIPATSTDQSS